MSGRQTSWLSPTHAHLGGQRWVSIPRKEERACERSCKRTRREGRMHLWACKFSLAEFSFILPLCVVAMGKRKAYVCNNDGWLISFWLASVITALQRWTYIRWKRCYPQFWTALLRRPQRTVSRKPVSRTPSLEDRAACKQSSQASSAFIAVRVSCLLELT